MKGWRVQPRLPAAARSCASRRATLGSPRGAARRPRGALGSLDVECGRSLIDLTLVRARVATALTEEESLPRWPSPGARFRYRSCPTLATYPAPDAVPHRFVAYPELVRRGLGCLTPFPGVKCARDAWACRSTRPASCPKSVARMPCGRTCCGHAQRSENAGPTAVEGALSCPAGRL